MANIKVYTTYMLYVHKTNTPQTPFLASLLRTVLQYFNKNTTTNTADDIISMMYSGSRCIKLRIQLNTGNAPVYSAINVKTTISSTESKIYSVMLSYIYYGISQ